LALKIGPNSKIGIFLIKLSFEMQLCRDKDNQWLKNILSMFSIDDNFRAKILIITKAFCKVA